MRKGKMFMAILLIVGMGLPGGWPWGGTPIAQAEEYAWSGWDGAQPPDSQGFRWAFPELWWYGKAAAFAYNADIEVRSEAATSFWVKGRAKQEDDKSYFGAMAEWGNPLDSGYIYRFTLRMPRTEGIPDLVTVNGQVVWTRNEYDEDADIVQFTYVPAADKEDVEIRLIRELDPADPVTEYPLYPPHQGSPADDGFISKRAPFAGPRPDYEMFALPEGTEYVRNDPHRSASYYFRTHGQGIEYDGYTLPELPYPTAKTKAVERWLPAVEGGSYYR